MVQNTSEITFQELSIGDVFNTKSGRWVKVSDTKFMCIMNNGLNNLGDIKKVDESHKNFSIVPLYVAK